VQTGNLTSSNIWAFKVRVQQQIKAEGQLLARVVNSYIKMEFFFTQDKPETIMAFTLSLKM